MMEIVAQLNDGKLSDENRAQLNDGNFWAQLNDGNSWAQLNDGNSWAWK